MAAPNAQSGKGSSRWGMSFLEKAVNSVEARLDTILAEGDEAPDTAATNGDTAKEKPLAPAAAAGHTKSNSACARSSDCR